MTFIATAWAISYCGAVPALVDIDPLTCTMDVSQVERRITPRTRAILPVHLYGQTAEMEPLLQLGEAYGLPVIEDAAQAHGATYFGRAAGTFGLAGCFSFYPSKNLGACGEGGALVTDSDEVAGQARALRDQGQTEKHRHDRIGFNYRMDGLQGAALGVKLAHLERWNASRRALAARYSAALAGLPLQLPLEGPNRRHVWHLYVVRHPEREAVRQALEAEGIATGLHYPVPVHLQKAYAFLGRQPGDFPATEQLSRECISLPIFPEMTTAQQDRVVTALHARLQTSRRAA
jgi:dTDP-4-amino-4,6-dideoxygalactose transaminase